MQVRPASFNHTTFIFKLHKSVVALASSAIGASYSLIKRLPVGFLAASAAMNGGIASAMFLCGHIRF
jgi:hypothetical protein